MLWISRLNAYGRLRVSSLNNVEFQLARGHTACISMQTFPMTTKKNRNNSWSDSTFSELVGHVHLNVLRVDSLFTNAWCLHSINKGESPFYQPKSSWPCLTPRSKGRACSLLVLAGSWRWTSPMQRQEEPPFTSQKSRNRQTTFGETKGARRGSDYFDRMAYHHSEG